MKLAAKVKLKPTPEQRQVLLETLERANAACNGISDATWDNEVFSQAGIHKLVYYDVRERFELSAQVMVRCILKVVQASRLDKKTKRTFIPHDAIVYDSRILRWFPDMQSVSIWTQNGREYFPFLAGPRQLELLQTQQGESDLGYIDGEFYLFTTCEIETPERIDVEGTLGVDVGKANIASDSDGEQYTGGHLHSWSFHDLDQKVLYKAEMHGVPVHFVDPAYSSQTCSACGRVDKRSHQDQAAFWRVG
ncbi:MAG: zinc ribbon domain-containing protein [Anaerolineales bacterium]|nr:zinc ribbon domain-containing protein [Anaerolineales bacterium]